jgi:predicted amidohydrolase
MVPEVQPGVAEDITLIQYISYLLPRITSVTERHVPSWPPDVFAVAASLLIKSGCYCLVLADWPPEAYRTDREDLEQWARTAKGFGTEWREKWVKEKAVPAHVDALWQELLGAGGLALKALDQNRNIWQVTLQLLAIADEASAGIGSPPPDKNRVFSEVDQLFLAEGTINQFLDQPNGATACREIHPSRARVLPKMHTPQNGLTIRSLSHYLALCTSNEVVPKWYVTQKPIREESINLLLIPWPFRVTPMQFRLAEPAQDEMWNMPDKFRFFTFDHQEIKGFRGQIEAIYEAALEQVGEIHGIVLPEMAVSETTCNQLRAFATEKNCFLICGVGKAAKDELPGENRVVLQFPSHDSQSQGKHHRWKLDDSQIKQYGLAGRLFPERDWWEYINVADRSFIFNAVSENLVMAVLICEDLARPDPVADLVRAVGPNLIVALLMDGPQLKERWASRYATVLADDPGSSVLSITSLGMSELSRPISGGQKSRVVALWKDPKTGPPVEISLDQGEEGIVLSLCIKKGEEWTADGRSDKRAAAYPTLAGIRGVRTGSPTVQS